MLRIFYGAQKWTANFEFRSTNVLSYSCYRACLGHHICDEIISISTWIIETIVKIYESTFDNTVNTVTYTEFWKFRKNSAAEIPEYIAAVKVRHYIPPLSVRCAYKYDLLNRFTIVYSDFFLCIKCCLKINMDPPVRKNRKSDVFFDGNDEINTNSCGLVCADARA